MRNEFNIIEAALESLTTHEREVIVRKHLETQAREVISRKLSQRIYDSELIINAVGEKLQQQMSGDGSNRFGEVCLDHGVDPRKMHYRRPISMQTVGDMLASIQANTPQSSKSHKSY